MVGRFPRAGVAGGALGAVAMAIVAGSLDPTPVRAAAKTVTYTSTGAEQTFTVPAFVTTLKVRLVGAPGAKAPDGGGRTGGSAGAGALVTADLAVTPGDVLYVEVGGSGAVSAGGFNGGGAGAVPSQGPYSGGSGDSGGGGGGTDLRTVSCGTSSQCLTGGVAGSLASRLVVAGGGGGGGGVSFGTYAANGAASGGSGGAAAATSQGVGGAGNPGANTNASAGGGAGGGGGTLSAGGAGGAQGAHSYPGVSNSTSGASGRGGNGGRNLSNAAGGGGGGYFGGGGGGAGGDDFNYAEGGGGGAGAGSSWAGTTASTVAIATDTTDTPLVDISYEVATKVSLAASQKDTPDGESVTLTATVTEVQGGDPTGTVQFVVNGRDYGSPVALSNDQASITISPLSPGTYTLGARYTGDPGFADASGSLAVRVVGTPFSRGPGVPIGPLEGLLGLGLLLIGAGVALAVRPTRV